jgi:hypothetical protein
MNIGTTPGSSGIMASEVPDKARFLRYTPFGRVLKPTNLLAGG